MLSSIEEIELKHLELRQIIDNIIDSEKIENLGKDLFHEEKFANKREYIKKIREDWAYLNEYLLNYYLKN